MDLDDIFKNNNKHQYKQEMPNYYRDHSSNHKNYSYSDKHENFNVFELLNSIKTNKKLKIIILVVLVIVIAVIIGLIVFLFPLITTMLNYISQNGISGLAEVVIDFLNKIWNGTK